MYFRVSKIVLTILLGISLVACSSGNKKTEAPAPEPAPATQDGANSRSFSDPVEQFNSMISGLRYPDGVARPGFSYKKADVQNDFAAWADKNVATIKSAMDKIPAEYALEITGHTDAVGPEQAEGDKKGNIFYSELRANAIKTALVKKGIPAARVVTRGVGSSSPIEGLDPKDPKNRRVTFSFIKTEAAPQNQ